jgi:transposase
VEQQQFVGLDVSQAETAVCVVDAAGAVLWQGKCASTPEAIAATLRRGAGRGPDRAGDRALVRVALARPGHARPAGGVHRRPARQGGVAVQLNKTDANDALGLAQIVRTGWYREVRVKSEASHRTRSLLAARAKLVEMRREVSHQIRGLLQTFGRLVGIAGTGRAFEPASASWPRATPRCPPRPPRCSGRAPPSRSRSRAWTSCCCPRRGTTPRAGG